MRTLRLCGLMLAVLAIHLAGWRMAVAGMPEFARAGARVRWLALAPLHVRSTVGVALLDASGPTLPAGVEGAGAPPSPASIVGRPDDDGATPPDHAAIDSPGTANAARRRQAAAVGAAQVGAGHHAAALGHPSPGSPWPVYATRPPPSTTIRYAIQQSGARPGANDAAAPAGEAELEWVHDGANFSLRVATAPRGRSAREWQSVGAFDAAGVAPDRLVERENGRDKRAINFDREQQRVRFSGASQALALAPGAQDRWSWIAQLAAIAEAASGGPVAGVATPAVRARGSAPAFRREPAAGTTWQIQVAGLRGELDRWVFRVLPDSDWPPEAAVGSNGMFTRLDRAPALLHVVRDPERPYDLRIEAWLSPSLHHLPIGLRMSAPPGSWSLALWPLARDGAASDPGLSGTGAPPRAAAASGT